MSEADIQDFQNTVWRYYDRAGRHDLPWRQPGAGGSFDPYKIMVSELMLQQTQVNRVILKYDYFLRRFPSAAALATAPLGDVLRAWNGLGYNRRAKFLHQAAAQIVNDYSGRLPNSEAELVKLSGVGHATAAAILAYAFNQPVAFVETNIRTVFIHHFFHDQVDVSDKAVLVLVRDTLPGENYREWYWALMDYGTHLKKTVGNLNRYSKSYAKQSRFEGSLRQVRGQVLRALHDGPKQLEDLRVEITDKRLDDVIAGLVKEKMIQKRGMTLRL